jgi:hypothetical protein
MYKVDFSNLDTEDMVVSGVLTENANLILGNKHPCTGLGWLNIQEDSCDKLCEAVIASNDILNFCAANREKLKTGCHIKITGLGIMRDKMVNLICNLISNNNTYDKSQKLMGVSYN